MNPNFTIRPALFCDPGGHGFGGCVWVHASIEVFPCLPIFGTGDWKVARTRRLESLRHTQLGQTFYKDFTNCFAGCGSL